MHATLPNSGFTRQIVRVRVYENSYNFLFFRSFLLNRIQQKIDLPLKP